MKKQLKSILALFLICAIVAVMMAVTNYITAPIIAKNEEAAANSALLDVLPGGGSFTSVDMEGKTLPATVTEIFSASNGGYVFKLVTAGYSTGLVIMCGIDADGTVSGTKCLASSETLGYEKTYGDAVKGASIATIDGIDTVSGATRTTTAYRAAVKDALNAFIILGGGEVDLRDPAEILRDNLIAALPAGEGGFTQLFIAEVLEIADEVYVADNGAGYVLLCGETFLGIDKDGNVLTEEISDEMRESAEKDAAAIMTSEITELSLSDYTGLPKQLLKASVTASGNYILEIRGAGFGIHGESWGHPSGEYIVVRVSLTPDGTILDTLTVSQAESDGIGSVCADSSFYSQFDGKNESNYREIDAISGATYTTDGYKEAIGKAFSVVKILEGGGTK